MNQGQFSALFSMFAMEKCMSHCAVIVDGRVDGVQPHGPGFDDVTHAWRQDDVHGKERWLFAGQTTVCPSGDKSCRQPGDKPEYLQLWASKAGTDWSKGFTALGDFFLTAKSGWG